MLHNQSVIQQPNPTVHATKKYLQLKNAGVAKQRSKRSRVPDMPPVEPGITEGERKWYSAETKRLQDEIAKAKKAGTDAIAKAKERLLDAERKAQAKQEAEQKLKDHNTAVAKEAAKNVSKPEQKPKELTPQDAREIEIQKAKKQKAETDLQEKLKAEIKAAQDAAERASKIQYEASMKEMQQKKEHEAETAAKKAPAVPPKTKNMTTNGDGRADDNKDVVMAPADAYLTRLPGHLVPFPASYAMTGVGAIVAIGGEIAENAILKLGGIALAAAGIYTGIAHCMSLDRILDKEFTVILYGAGGLISFAVGWIMPMITMEIIGLLGMIGAIAGQTHHMYLWANGFLNTVDKAVEKVLPIAEDPVGTIVSGLLGNPNTNKPKPPKKLDKIQDVPGAIGGLASPWDVLPPSVNEWLFGKSKQEKVQGNVPKKVEHGKPTTVNQKTRFNGRR